MAAGRRRKSSAASLGFPPDSDMATTTKTAQRTPVRNRRTAKEKRSPWACYREVSGRNTWLAPLAVMLAVVGGYAANPTAQNPLHAALFLSYPQPPDPTSRWPQAAQYGKGVKDVVFVAFYTVFFTFTRELLMSRLLRPLALRNGLTRRAKIARFAEQSYTAAYFAVFVPFGLYVMYRTEVWYFRTRGFYERYPHRSHTADFKAYYLLQAAYWQQQAVVLMLQLEKPRKDFYELVLHHVVTLALIASSYRYHFTYMGIAVFVTHDVSDFFLATSKALNYLDHWIIGPYFAFFIAVWIYTRHYINLGIIFSIAREFRTVGPFFLDWDRGFYKCELAQLIAGTLLGAIQALNLFWLWFILRIAKRFVLSAEAVDERSEDEADDLPPITTERAPNGTAVTTTTTTGNGNGHTANGDGRKDL